MADNQFSITCPTDCTGVYPAIADINPECPGQISRSEVSEVLFMHPTLGVGPTDWSPRGWSYCHTPPHSSPTPCWCCSLSYSLYSCSPRRRASRGWRTTSSRARSRHRRGCWRICCCHS